MYAFIARVDDDEDNDVADLVAPETGRGTKRKGEKAAIPDGTWSSELPPGKKRSSRYDLRRRDRNPREFEE